ncbi:MAG: hypothetical protein JNL28_16360 [Planctomycetes bacterium]|nr:hypothetical protein [Planctomycetota bacterium]
MKSLSIAVFALFQAAGVPATEAPVSALKQVATIPLPGVEGRIDHMNWAGYSNVLFIAARDYGTVEQISLVQNKVGKPFLGPRAPQGLASASGMIFATDGRRGRVWAFPIEWDILLPDWHSKHTDIGPDADNIRFLRSSWTLLVGYGDGALGSMSVPELEVQFRIELGGHPESFQLDSAEKQVWVNVPSKQGIAVVDLEAKKVARWIELKTAKQNYPMALAEKDKRLLVGCREPARLLVFDIETDAMTAELPLSGDVDDIFVDEERGFVYASCGEGFVDVFERAKPGEWKLKEKVATSPGARTCLFVPSEKKLFVAVPHRGEQQAEVRVFSTAP